MTRFRARTTMATQNSPRQKSKTSGVIVARGFDSYLGSLDREKRKEYTMVPVVDLLIRNHYLSSETMDVDKPKEVTIHKKEEISEKLIKGG